MWAADPDAGTVGTIAGAAAQASYAFDTVLGEGVSNAEVRGLKKPTCIAGSKRLYVEVMPTACQRWITVAPGLRTEKIRSWSRPVSPHQ